MKSHGFKFPTKIFWNKCFNKYLNNCRKIDSATIYSINLTMMTINIVQSLHCASECIDRKNLYGKNQKFRSILEGGIHCQPFLKPRSAFFFVLLSGVLTWFSGFLQISIGKFHIWLHKSKSGIRPSNLSLKSDFP